jgi:hypothetical protein
MSSATIRTCVCLAIWGGTLAATLAIANQPGDWGHSVCGIWGCGPPLQALVGCHASWLVVLVPVGLLLRSKTSPATFRIVTISSLFIALAGVVSVSVYETCTWFTTVGDTVKAYLGHRIVFVLLTTIELPILELLGLSSVAMFIDRRRRLATGNHDRSILSSAPDHVTVKAGRTQ